MANRWRNLATKAVEEIKRLLVMFVYLWVVFGQFVLYQTVMAGKEHQSYAPHGFALINAIVLAKVMLVAEDLKLGHRFEDLPLIIPVIFKAVAFAVLFIVFYVLEKVIVGMLGGKTAAESFPQIGGGTLTGILCVLGIAFVSLIPFFTIREIARVIGGRELRNLMFRRGTHLYTLMATPRQA